MIKVNSFYPVIMTRDVPGSTAFYTEHFGFLIDVITVIPPSAEYASQYTESSVEPARESPEGS